ncbi:DEAD/DEAH box helicase [Herbiconiux sp. CPCC 205716]|uniref:DEAD/DEAH box helicase n=1 Tax=Herbiconiux gentiana TaxID=2970912 RepID=A0ABT2GHI7_9MICO|nr:DEAD/DEAH box helicase [Herbiconiux gentiana]MCS5715643.1 DEAD/DEAH box helicase [Herbiconiux gentiana]
MPPAPPSSWRSAVDELSPAGPERAQSGAHSATAGEQRSGRTGRGGPGSEGTTPMGLQFEVREEAPRDHDRWRGPSTRAATAEGAAAEGAPRRLAVRPVIRSASGSYVKANIAWGSFAHQVNRLALDPAHHRWFAQFAALHRATRPPHAVPETDWLTLDDFLSPLLWQLLAEARRLGIALVSSAKAGTVQVSGCASVSFDARQRSGDLRLTPLVAFAETPGAADDSGAEARDHPGGTREEGDETDIDLHPAQHAGAIGDHGIYAYDLGRPKRPRIELAPAAHPLTIEEQRALGRPAITVPAADTAQFFEEYYPALRRGILLTSSDGSVALPTVAPPTLVLTARFLADDVLTLDWDWVGLRDPASERHTRDAAREQLGTALRRFPAAAALEIDADAPPVTLDGVTAAAFAEKGLAVLDALENVRVDVIGPRPAYRELIGHPDISITHVETLKRDWFDLGIVVNINGYRVPFGPLFKALAKGRTRLLMVDKTYLSLEHPAFDRLRELLEESTALDEWETGLRVSRHQAARLADFDDTADETPDALAWRQAVRAAQQLASATDDPVPPTPVPATVSATLRPYQKAGFDWLAFLHRNRLGGVLADDMGLGKTLQTLALIAHAREHPAAGAVDGAGTAAQPPGAPGAGAAVHPPPFLVVAPTSVVGTWQAEAAHFTPGLDVRALTATQGSSARLAEAAAGADVVVTSYALFRLDAAHYRALDWAGLVLDEAQFVKNHLSKAHEAARELDVPFRLAITGTPLENNLLELWALLDIVAPGLFPSARLFAEKFQRPIERGIDPRALATLRQRIRPVLLRRTKDAVAPELPEKQEQVLPVELSPAHRHLYDTVLQRERQKLFGLLDDLDRNRFIVFRSLTLLRMLSLDASLIDDAHASIPSSKLDVLVEQLTEVIGEGHRSLVFSQFTSYLAKVAARLDSEGIAYEYLDGSTRRRPEVVERFRAGSAPVFLISLKAGGFGLTLTEADYVYLLDPWWNPASESQAIDRTHRIGQEHPVNVYRLVASDTIEEKVMALKEHKAELFDAVLDDDALFSRSLTADDLRALLA